MSGWKTFFATKWWDFSHVKLSRQSKYRALKIMLDLHNQSRGMSTKSKQFCLTRSLPLHHSSCDFWHKKGHNEKKSPVMHTAKFFHAIVETCDKSGRMETELPRKCFRKHGLKLFCHSLQIVQEEKKRILFAQLESHP